MVLLLNHEEQPQVINFDPETAFFLSTDKRVRIPNTNCLFYKNFLMVKLQDIEHIEEAKTAGIILFEVLTPFLCK